MRTEIRYIAEDGTPFENQVDCREMKISWQQKKRTKEREK